MYYVCITHIIKNVFVQFVFKMTRAFFMYERTISKYTYYIIINQFTFNKYFR